MTPIRMEKLPQYSRNSKSELRLSRYAAQSTIQSANRTGMSQRWRIDCRKTFQCFGGWRCFGSIMQGSYRKVNRNRSLPQTGAAPIRDGIADSLRHNLGMNRYQKDGVVLCLVFF